jgi:hypothetical protein
MINAKRDDRGGGTICCVMMVYRNVIAEAESMARRILVPETVHFCYRYPGTISSPKNNFETITMASAATTQCTRKRNHPSSSSDEESSASNTRKAIKSNSPPESMTSSDEASLLSSGQEVSGRFIIPENLPKFTWKPLKTRKGDFIHPVRKSFSCSRLLLKDALSTKVQRSIKF